MIDITSVETRVRMVLSYAKVLNPILHKQGYINTTQDITLEGLCGRNTVSTGSLARGHLI